MMLQNNQKTQDSGLGTAGIADIDNSLDEESKNIVNIIQKYKDSAMMYKFRRMNEWNENYALYRDRVILNRLTQRQSVNIPVIKFSVKTLLKNIKTIPDIHFSNLDNDTQAEHNLNLYWKQEGVENNHMKIKDKADKRQAFLFGRTFKMPNVVRGKLYWEIVDPMDVLVDRYIDPTDFNTSRFVCQEHIFKALSSLEGDDQYNQTIISKLKESYATAQGLIKQQETLMNMKAKEQRMLSMGVPDVLNPILGETYVELNKAFFYKKYPRF